MKSSFYVALSVAFIDHMGVGLIYPLFSSMILDSSLPLLPPETAHSVRGFWLGILLCLMPFAQFFSAPWWGGFSDSKGRKKPLQYSLIIALLGYLTALCGVFFTSIALLLFSRILVGVAAGNMSIVQACIADLSPPAEKTKNFALYSMALGAGFTLGPFFGGALSSWGYSLPFLFAALIVGVNIILAFTLFKETHHVPLKRQLTWNMAIAQLKKAFHFKGLRTILIASFLHNFGWSYFFEFSPVYLITRFQFSPANIGLFFGVAGATYALSTGLLIRPLIRRFKPEALFFSGNLLTALTILSFSFVPTFFWIWPCLILICYFVAYVMPTATTIVSNSASAQIQGEALGIFSSVNAAALALSPLFSGSLVGAYPTLPMWAGGSILLIAALIVLAVFRRRLLPKRL
jgi:MFS transporter, DHA1 family, tetracycline resistance protein